MPNNFIKHGITHLSPSSVNKFADAPDAWAAQYLFGKKFSFSSAARGGVAVERAIVDALRIGDYYEATSAAVKEYSKETAFDNSATAAKWKDALPSMIELGFKELKDFGQPEFEDDGSQKKIGIACNMGDYVVPITGFTDLDYPQHNLVVDLKCTQRMPSEMSKSHLRQAAIYKQATGREVKFLYVTGKKAQWFEVGDVKDILEEFKTIVFRMNNLLAFDKEVIQQIIPVTDSFYWSDDGAIRKELYGL